MAYRFFSPIELVYNFRASLTRAFWRECDWAAFLIWELGCKWINFWILSSYLWRESNGLVNIVSRKGSSGKVVTNFIFKSSKKRILILIWIEWSLISNSRCWLWHSAKIISLWWKACSLKFVSINVTNSCWSDTTLLRIGLERRHWLKIGLRWIEWNGWLSLHLCVLLTSHTDVVICLFKLGLKHFDLRREHVVLATAHHYNMLLLSNFLPQF